MNKSKRDMLQNYHKMHIITNNKYAPLNRVLNRSKLNKVRVVFETAVISHETSLINNILPKIDLLNN